MAITATTNGVVRELIPAGNYIARCYKMIEIGTVTEDFQGKPKQLKKVRVTWELPTELKVFKEENGEQPLVIDKEYTLSMFEGSTLRKDLQSWRGKAFTEEEAKAFDVSKLIGAPCMLNIIHKPSKDGSKHYENIAGVTPMPKGMSCPPQINKTFVLDYETFSQEKFDTLPDFIKNKMKESTEYKVMFGQQAMVETQVNDPFAPVPPTNTYATSAPAPTPQGNYSNNGAVGSLPPIVPTSDLPF